MIFSATEIFEKIKIEDYLIVYISEYLNNIINQNINQYLDKKIYIELNLIQEYLNKQDIFNFNLHEITNFNKIWILRYIIKTNKINKDILNILNNLDNGQIFKNIDWNNLKVIVEFIKINQENILKNNEIKYNLSKYFDKIFEKLSKNQKIYLHRIFNIKPMSQTKKIKKDKNKI